jgi:elongation factor G
MTSAVPVLWMPIFAVTSDDRRRLLESLEAIGREDSAVLTRRDLTTGELLYSGTSVEHLTQAFRKIFDEMGIASWTGKPRVRCLETIRRAAEAEGKYIRQTGGSGNYGHVKLRLEPAERGTGLAFVSEIRGGVVPEIFVAPVEEGIRETARGGILAGHEMTDLRVTLFDGSYHEADSNPVAFGIAASLAFKEAARQAKPVVLEPMMMTVFTVAESKLGAQVTELNDIRGRIEEISIVSGVAIVRATVPLGAMLEYDGPAAHIMQFSGYEPMHRPPEGDNAGANMLRPRWPDGGFDAASADPGADWT